MQTLEEVLAECRADAAVLARYGQKDLAAALERLAKNVERSAKDWLVWLSETNAGLKSGRSVPWLRSRYATWERAGHARRVVGHRQYRAVVIPERDHSAQHEAGKAAALERIRSGSLPSGGL